MPAEPILPHAYKTQANKQTTRSDPVPVVRGDVHPIDAPQSGKARRSRSKAPVSGVFSHLSIENGSKRPHEEGASSRGGGGWADTPSTQEAARGPRLSALSRHLWRGGGQEGFGAAREGRPRESPLSLPDLRAILFFSGGYAESR